MVYFRKEDVIQIGVGQAHVGGHSEPVECLKCDFLVPNFKRKSIFNILVAFSRFKPWMTRILHHFQREIELDF